MTTVSFFLKCTSEKRRQFKNCAKVLTLTRGESLELEKQKLLKVAILGRTNVGKSTLINQIIQLNICDVSKKTHTTLFPLKAAFNIKNTQIIFVDTPGIISKSEISKLSFKKNFDNKNFDKWEKVFKEVDVVAVMEEAKFFKCSLEFDNLLLERLHDISKVKPLILVINKIDLLKDKSYLLKVVDWLVTLEKNNEMNLKFQKIFLISALKNDGVKDIILYLLDEAKEGEWILDKDLVCDTPLDKLIINLIRAQFLNLLPFEIPYKFEYKISILEKNLGQIFCEVIVISPKKIFLQMILRKASLKTLTQSVETDLYNILKISIKLKVSIEIKQKS